MWKSTQENFSNNCTREASKRDTNQEVIATDACMETY